MACAAMVIFFALTSCSQGGGVIRTEVPERPVGQEDVLGLRVPAMDTVRIGFVGLGMRGESAVSRYVYVPWTKIVALCDVEPERVQKCVDHLVAKGVLEAGAMDAGSAASEGDPATSAGAEGNPETVALTAAEPTGNPESAALTTAEPTGNPETTIDGHGIGTYVGLEGYKELCERDDIDLVYICTAWQHHVPIALYAMEHGKHVAIEVPAATSLEDCWALVNTAERTRLHCIMLENCCYDFFELSALQMARNNVFGEVLHVEGAYHHNLIDYWDQYWDNWRLDYNSKHKGDVYPTHGFGPICQVLNIHRGDRLKTLVAMETKSVNGRKWQKRFQGEDMPDFQNGDQTCTMIETQNGKTVLIEHNVMTPHPYNRMYQIVGTEGYAAKYPINVYSLCEEKMDEIGLDHPANFDFHGALTEEQVAALRDKYPTPILDDELEALSKKVGGHGGMDFLMDYRLIYCLHNGLPLDMDVYDLAEWCCVSELGAISIENGCAPVEVPDFTRGAWDRLDGFQYAFADGSFK